MASNLPTEIILGEILTRTSPETVAKFRAVSKHFNEASYEWNFAEKLHRRTDTISGFFFQYYSKNDFKHRYIAINESSRDLSFAFLPLKLAKIEAATKQGLVLCRCEALAPRHPPWFFVCKPATQQWREIPRPKTRYSTQRITMTILSSNADELRYKIVRFSKPKPSILSRKSGDFCVYRCEVFDSATWAWRVLPEDVRVPFGEMVSFEEPVVSTAGFFYALTSERRILAFDWTAESCHVADSLPAPLSEGGRQVALFECEGKLGAVFVGEPYTCMELWVSEHGVRVWNMRKRANIECLNKLGYESHWVYALAMASKDVLVLRTNSGIYFFRLGIGGYSQKNPVVKTVDYGQKSIDELFTISDVFFMESNEELVDLNVKSMNVEEPRSVRKKLQKKLSSSSVSYTTSE